MYLWRKEDGKRRQKYLMELVINGQSLWCWTWRRNQKKKSYTLKGDNKEHCCVLQNFLSQKLSVAKSSLTSGRKSCPPPFFTLVLALTLTYMGRVHTHSLRDFICVIALLWWGKRFHCISKLLASWKDKCLI